MIEIRKYQIRSAGGKLKTSTKEITLPSNWVKEHGIEVGDVVSVITNNILIVIPPRTSREEESRILTFVRGVDE